MRDATVWGCGDAISLLVTDWRSGVGQGLTNLTRLMWFVNVTSYTSRMAWHTVLRAVRCLPMLQNLGFKYILLLA